MPFLAAIDHLVLTVSDVDRSLDFYCNVLGCEPISFGENRKAFGVGNQKINLHEAGREIVPHAQTPVPGSADLCFLSTVPVAALAKHLAAHGHPVELGPVERQGAAFALVSIYVRAPDGNLIEIANRRHDSL